MNVDAATGPFVPDRERARGLRQKRRRVGPAMLHRTIHAMRAMPPAGHRLRL